MQNNPNYYAILTADVRYCPDLSSSEKLLYAEITALSNKEGFCKASNKYFAELYHSTDVTISRQISNLEKQGFIRIEYDKNGAKVSQRRIFTINKNVNGNSVTVNKNVNRTINKNVKENNTSNIILQDNNNIISQDAKDCAELLCSQLEKNGLKPRSEAVRKQYAKCFEVLFGAYSIDEVKRMIMYATTNDFWKKICLSAYNISKHAERLYVGSLTDKPKGQLDCDRVENTEVNF